MAFAHGTQFTSKDLESYAAALGEISPVRQPWVYLVSGDSEAAETAIKLDGVDGDAILLGPPFIITEAQFEWGVTALREAIAEVTSCSVGGQSRQLYAGFRTRAITNFK